MSVVTRNLATGTIEVLCKGADSVIAKLLRDKDSEEFKNTLSAIEKYAAIGLRTLILAKTEISKEKYEQWASERAEVELLLENKEEALD